MLTEMVCRVCGEEFADWDYGPDEIPEDAKTDERGNILVVCADCE